MCENIHHKMYRIGYVLRLVFALLTIVVMASCRHDSIEDRAEEEAKNYTKRYCPTPVKDFQRTDSITFNRPTHTFSYYYTLVDKADDASLAQKIRGQLKVSLLEGLRSDTKSKSYKEAGFNFHYVYRSAKTNRVLVEETFTKKDYQQAD